MGYDKVESFHIKNREISLWKESGLEEIILQEVFDTRDYRAPKKAEWRIGSGWK